MALIDLIHFSSLVTHTQTHTTHTLCPVCGDTILISVELSTGASLTLALCSSLPLIKLIQTPLSAPLLDVKLPSQCSVPIIFTSRS